MKNTWKRIIAFLCGTSLICGSAFGCFAAEENQEEETEIYVQESDPGARITDFSVALLQECVGEEGNLMISPVSVMAALAMLGNGAGGETLAQMEDVFGMTMPELNQYLQVYLDSLSESKGCEWNTGNSIWLNEAAGEGAVKDTFLEANSGYHDAEIASLPFDEAALETINQWVSEKTNGKIDQMLNSISPDAMMYLINAIAFQGDWSEVYEEHQVEDGTFTREDGTEEEARLMFSQEDVYLKDQGACGFLKYYEGSRYAFAALLPEEDMPLQEYISSLSGERLRDILQNTEKAVVYAKLPKFQSEYSVELNEALKNLGITDAFQEKADFTGVSDIPLAIDRVLHKTYIDVNETGTEAAAATVVEVKAMAALPEDPEELNTYEVYLDRPFLYMIVDMDTMIPVFAGTVMQLDK